MTFPDEWLEFSGSNHQVCRCPSHIFEDKFGSSPVSQLLRELEVNNVTILCSKWQPPEFVRTSGSTTERAITRGRAEL
jgi:hypothetical protein